MGNFEGNFILRQRYWYLLFPSSCSFSIAAGRTLSLSHSLAGDPGLWLLPTSSSPGICWHPPDCDFVHADNSNFVSRMQEYLGGVLRLVDWSVNYPSITRSMFPAAGPSNPRPDPG